MFDMKRPCLNCPFRKGMGETFRMSQCCLEQIVGAIYFQCHKMVNYIGNRPSLGDRPQ